MTGFGEAHVQGDGLAVAIEVRTINSRYLKLSYRCTDGYSSLEPQVEAVVRKTVKRGTVQVSLRLDRVPSSEDFQINTAVLSGYLQQLKSLYDRLQVSQSVDLEPLLSLPGVVNEVGRPAAAAAKDWQLVERTLVEAMDHLARMRQSEGRVMATDLNTNCELIAKELGQIEQRAPQVVDAYRSRLAERLKKIVEDLDVSIEPADIVREVAIFADRSDLSEECVRMRSHLAQFDTISNHKESSGRKLDFLTQEMVRETNTIGSKANDATISRHVIEVKAAIERMREMIQNVE